MIQLLFIRHSHSCANMAADFHHYLDVLRERDPPLSAAGIDMIETAVSSNLLFEKCPDLLITSSLVRAIQTGFLLWKRKQTIHVAPYLLEDSIGPSNTPIHEVNVQDTVLATHFTPPTNLYASLPQKLKRHDGAYTTKGNLNKFVDWLRTNVDVKDGSVVAVVTHSKLMKRDLGLKTKPDNVGIIKVEFTPEEWRSSFRIRLKDHLFQEVSPGFKVDGARREALTLASEDCAWRRRQIEKEKKKNK